jgi:hypothetical protein
MEYSLDVVRLVPMGLWMMMADCLKRGLAD